jgi:hypothetical protein
MFVFFLFYCSADSTTRCPVQDRPRTCTSEETCMHVLSHICIALVFTHVPQPPVDVNASLSTPVTAEPRLAHSHVFIPFFKTLCSARSSAPQHTLIRSSILNSHSAHPTHTRNSSHFCCLKRYSSLSSGSNACEGCVVVCSDWSESNSHTHMHRHRLLLSEHLSKQPRPSLRQLARYALV